MSHRFALTRAQIIGLVLAQLLGAILLFAGGMLTGAWLARGRSDSDRGSSAESQDRGVGSSAGPQTGVPEAAAGTSSGRKSAPPERIYEVQVAARLTRERADTEVERLAAAGYPASVLETKDSRGHSIFTVRMGPYSSASEAAAAAQAFREHSGLDDLQPVIRHRPKPPDTAPRAGVPAAETPG